MIDDHLLALASEDYTSACTRMRQMCRSALNEHSRELADFCELDEAVAAAANAAFGSTPAHIQQCALAQRIQDLSRVHEWGDNLTLIALVYAMEISAKLFQVTTTTPDDARVVQHPAIASIARPCNEHLGKEREIMLLHSPSHWQVMLTIEQAKTANQTGPIVHYDQDIFMVFGIPADNSCQFGAFFWAGQQQGLLNASDLPGPVPAPTITTKLNATVAKAATAFTFLAASPHLLAQLPQQHDGTASSLLLRCKPQSLTLQKGVKVDFYTKTQHAKSLHLYFSGLKMTYGREEWVLRNVFYSRPLTNCHTVALLAHEDGRDAFVCLQTDNCPVVPCEPYEFATPECMKSINSRPMTARIEEDYSDKFRNLVGEESVAAPAAATPKRLASGRAVLASSKKIKVASENGGASDDGGVDVTALKQKLELVGSRSVQ